jgi:hypothetical protein
MSWTVSISSRNALFGSDSYDGKESWLFTMTPKPNGDCYRKTNCYQKSWKSKKRRYRTTFEELRKIKYIKREEIH